ncbi:uncharacterized protein PG998_014647 [Apiospora kogelbergensis]|uniref:uncharacterized protein n=1 Tax=Apiospora kogelbergensis TaxID=1337665 RepID=UPI0031327F8B
MPSIGATIVTVIVIATVATAGDDGLKWATWRKMSMSWLCIRPAAESAGPQRSKTARQDCAYCRSTIQDSTESLWICFCRAECIRTVQVV